MRERQRHLGVHGGFPDGSAIKNLPASAGDVRDVVLVPWVRRFPGGGHGNPLQYSCLENPKNRGDWWATGHQEMDTTEHEHLLDI